MNEYKIEKSLFLVKVFFIDGTIKEGSVFLSLQAAHHEGHETVNDVLNQKEQFIPINFKEEQIRLININRIAVIDGLRYPDICILKSSEQTAQNCTAL